jgi:hypothetical protein
MNNLRSESLKRENLAFVDQGLYVGRRVTKKQKEKAKILEKRLAENYKDALLEVVRYGRTHSGKAVTLHTQGIKYKDQPKDDMSLWRWGKHDMSSQHRHKVSRKGYVYIASIQGYEKEDYIKIGFSSNPEYRMKQLSTNNMLTHTLEFGKLFDSASQAEKYTHFLLEQQGYERDGEYFKVDIAKARRVIDNIIQPRIVTNEKLLTQAYKINRAIDKLKFWLLAA